MSSRLFRLRPLATVSLVLVAAGSVAVACSSDSTPNTDDPSLTPDGTGNGAAPGTGGSTGNGDPVGQSGAGAGTGTSGSEGQAGAGLIDQNPPDEPGAGGSGTQEPPPPVGLAPNCTPAEGDVANLTLELVADGLDQPLYVTGVPGDDTRLFVIEKGGSVRVILNGELLEEPFLNLPSGQGAEVNAGGERGLLGLAFHPNYATNGLFYVHFSSGGADGLPAASSTVIAEYQVDANNRSLANPASRRIVLTVAQPQNETNHKGGMITFGRDGFLHIGLGDGGGGNDNHGAIGNGQALNTLLGKILRIDPLGRGVNNAYSIPEGNLAATNQAASAEIWAYGLRNPWRFSFDACNGDLYVGDVGQDTLEEIDFVSAAADTRTVAAGTNFGWRIMEGPNCRPNDGVCNAQTQVGLTLPVESYPTPGQPRGSVTGGYVYRGSNIPSLRGAYLYADYNRGTFIRFRMEAGQMVARADITNQLRDGNTPGQIASFGQDNAGEVYVTAFQPGAVYRLAAAQ